jgi:uncharacterized Fe-S cluster protein YjdI
MVPTGMTSQVHAFDPREGGSFRISLTYDDPTGAGKTTADTDTFHGRFVKLVENEQVVEVVEFETADPGLRGEMTITITLADADGGTDILAVHDDLPPSLSTTDNEAGWRSSLAKLAAFVEAVKPLQTYETPGITVTFDPNICIHSGVCLRGLPAVFDVRRKRWVRPELASGAEVAAQVARCPSGALQYRFPTSEASTT